MSSRSSSHRHQPYEATRNRKKRRNKTGVVFKSPDKKRIRNYSTGSWFDQESLEHTYKMLSDISPVSASRKKLIDYSSDESENEDDLFETEGEEEGTYKTDCWIIDVELLSECIKKVAVCKCCHSELHFTELVNFRAGLATKFSLECRNVECAHLRDCSFTTTRKIGQIFEVNRKSVLAS